MPPRILRDVLVLDRSTLARNMYQLLFTRETRFRVRFGEEFQSLFKKSLRMRPDLLIINSNAFERERELEFPCPTILIVSKGRLDLKEQGVGKDGVVLIEKPFYPYELISVANGLVLKSKERKRKGRRRRG